MKYHVTLRSRTYVIDIDGGAVTVDGERLEAHWAAIPGTPLIHLLLGKDSWTIACQQLDGRNSLGFVRSRATPRADLDRMINQRQAMSALMQRGASPLL